MRKFKSKKARKGRCSNGPLKPFEQIEANSGQCGKRHLNVKVDLMAAKVFLIIFGMFIKFLMVIL